MRITWNNGTKCLGRCLGHSKPLVNIGFLPLYHSKISLIYISRMDGLGYCKLLSGCQFAPSIVSHISFLELSWQIVRNLLAKIEALALLVLEIGSQKSKSRCLQDRGPSRGSSRDFIPCLFQFLMAVGIPGLVVAHSNLCLCLYITFSCLSNLSHVSLVRTCIMGFRGHQGLPWWLRW